MTKKQFVKDAVQKAATTKAVEKGIVSPDKSLITGDVDKPIEKLVMSGNNGLIARMITPPNGRSCNVSGSSNTRAGMIHATIVVETRII